jgi:predicted transcriptional regulator
MGKPADGLTLDDDVQQESSRLAERSGRTVGTLANAGLRDYIRYETEVNASVERGVADLDAGRARTTDEVLELLRTQRSARRRG